MPGLWKVKWEVEGTFELGFSGRIAGVCLCVSRM